MMSYNRHSVLNHQPHDLPKLTKIYYIKFAFCPGEQWIPLTKGQWCGRYFHAMIHSCSWTHSMDHSIWVPNQYIDVIMGAMAYQFTSLTIVYSIVYSGADQRKHQSSALLAFVRGIHRWPEHSANKGTVMRKMFPFYDVIMTLCERGVSLDAICQEICMIYF